MNEYSDTMKEFMKKNVAIVLAFSLPIVLIAVIALSTYLPSAFLSTDYNFVYSSCTNSANYFPYPYTCSSYLQQRYSVADNTLVINTVEPALDSTKDSIRDVNVDYDARLFFYDTTKNESREITLEEAQALLLDSSLTSPDGVSVSGRNTRGGDFFFLFGGGSSYDYYLTKGKRRSKLNLVSQDDRYGSRDNFKFIGWVLPVQNS